MIQQRFVTVDVLLLDEQVAVAKRAIADLERFVERYKAAAEAAAAAHDNGAGAEPRT